MKQIGEGIYVEEHEGYRSYIVEADYSEHIESFKSKENAEQEIKLREDAPAEEILDYIKKRGHDAELGGDEMIFIETEQPTKLVKDLCDGNYIDAEQATAIMMHEIEHIKNPAMKAKIMGGKEIREFREVIIQYKMSQDIKAKTGKDAHDVGSGTPPAKGGLKGK